MWTFWRVHPVGEAPETVLDPRRPDGWVAGDEEYETQPLGVSCCASLEDMRRYIRHYSLTVQPGDVVLEVLGREVGEARDAYEARVVVSEIVAVHPATILDEA